ncbi:MAG: hypothetical protein QGH45_07015 [Myxococcota bacterium]|jgi:hypothetical protein|nr:hypothetical protein [Myxococcota bacterium]
MTKETKGTAPPPVEELNPYEQFVELARGGVHVRRGQINDCRKDERSAAIHAVMKEDRIDGVKELAAQWSNGEIELTTNDAEYIVLMYDELREDQESGNPGEFT